MAGERNLPHFEPERIDYRILANALEHYTTFGYPYCEVPWVVRPEAMAVTLPPHTEATHNQYSDLVGSGEQSFIELMMRGEQPIKACCITPCFRLEPKYDELHHGYFIKLELFDPDASPPALLAMMACARAFFEHYTETAIEKTGPAMYDIVDAKNGIELGSYGFRTWDERKFIYGTGVALPRLSTAQSTPPVPSQNMKIVLR